MWFRGKIDNNKYKRLLIAPEFYIIESEIAKRTMYVSDGKEFMLIKDQEGLLLPIEDVPQLLPSLRKEYQNEVKDIYEDIIYLKRAGVTSWKAQTINDLDRRYKNEKTKTSLQTKLSF